MFVKRKNITKITFSVNFLNKNIICPPRLTTFMGKKIASIPIDFKQAVLTVAIIPLNFSNRRLAVCVSILITRSQYGTLAGRTDPCARKRSVCKRCVCVCVATRENTHTRTHAHAIDGPYSSAAPSSAASRRFSAESELQQRSVAKRRRRRRRRFRLKIFHPV